MRYEPNSRVEKVVLDDYSPQVTLSSNQASELASRIYKKLMQESIGPFKVLDVCPNTIVLGEDRIPSHISTERMPNSKQTK